jgi:peptidoglycan hydrolase-like amidase
LWAQLLAQRWYTARQIIDYYYPGILIHKIN